MDTIQDEVNALRERVRRLELAVFASNDNRALPAKVKKLSAKEFLMTKRLKSEAQKVLALGYFLEDTEHMESFNVKDLEAAFRAAKEKPPKNMNDVINKNIARGLLMEAPSKKNARKAWSLTSTGENFLEDHLSSK